MLNNIKSTCQLEIFVDGELELNLDFYSSEAAEIYNEYLKIALAHDSDILQEIFIEKYLPDHNTRSDIAARIVYTFKTCDNGVIKVYLVEGQHNFKIEDQIKSEESDLLFDILSSNDTLNRSDLDEIVKGEKNWIN